MSLIVQDYNMGEEDPQSSQWYGVREATLFVVDATQKMFEVDPETNLSHIQKFFKVSYVLRTLYCLYTNIGESYCNLYELLYNF